MSEIDDLKRRVARLEVQTEALRGALNAALTALESAVDHGAVAVSHRTARSWAHPRSFRNWSDGNFRRGYTYVARRLRKFGRDYVKATADQVAEHERKYGPI